MGKIKDNLIRLLGGIPFEDYLKGLEEYKQFCNKTIKEWENSHTIANCITIVKKPVQLKTSRIVEKDCYNDNAVKEDILKGFMVQIDKNNLLMMCATTTTEDNMVRIDAWMEVIPPQ